MPYESKPMKKQWIEVEGKMTPIILPQIWSHEKQDWVVTSEQNPLPTQVTGSIVELYKEKDVEIEANSTLNLKRIILIKHRCVFAVVRADDSHDFRLMLNWRVTPTNTEGWHLESEEVFNVKNGRYGMSKEHILTKSNIASFSLENHSDEKQKYPAIAIMGVD